MNSNMFLGRAVLISPRRLFCTFSDTKCGATTMATVFWGFFAKILASKSQQSFRSVPVTLPNLVKSSQTTVPAQDWWSPKSLMNWQGHGKTKCWIWNKLSQPTKKFQRTICNNQSQRVSDFLHWGITILGHRFGHQLHMFMISEVGLFKHLQQVVSYSSVSVDCSVCVAFWLHLHMLQRCYKTNRTGDFETRDK